MIRKIKNKMMKFKVTKEVYCFNKLMRKTKLKNWTITKKRHIIK